jgi:cation transporter-like permease
MTMADAPNAPNRKLRIAGAVVLFGALFAILIAAGWYAAGAWNAVNGPPMPTTGYVAMILGVVFSLLVGCGLMALLFYSSRHGYDDPHQSEHDRRQ